MAKIIEKLATCNNCQTERILQFHFDEEGNCIAVEPFICKGCLDTSYTVRFDADIKNWHGVFGSNG